MRLFSSSRKHRSILAIFAALLAVSLFTFALPSANQAGAYSAYSVRTPFLALPFESTPRMQILSGWYYNGSGSYHGGIDYINGNYNNVSSWRTFPVFAAADGEACGNCSSRQGNAVFIKHNVDGVTYYTYYGHLASISTTIPKGSQSRTVHVVRGQYLGMAGDTGASGLIHLHFALMNAYSTPIDPYSINRLRGWYPAPTAGQYPAIGWFLGN
jgi:murein DD-endopeptidase MepM/ murein hydrolase activator NlpD